MLKNNLLSMLLAGVLTLTSIGAAVMIYTYIQTATKVQHNQGLITVINRNQGSLQNLANDAVQYSRRNPAIDPLLQSLGFKARTTTNQPAAGAPAARPANPQQR